MFLSIVVPCCNEEEGLREFHRQMTLAARALCGEKFELIFVDDGSTDNTWKLINKLSAADRNVVAVRLSRNHGHQLALTAGLSTVRGDLVLVIDADLQDPPELLGPMYDLMVREDADVVYGLRRSRAGESRFKRATAHLFYRLLDSISSVGIPADVGDFRLIDRKVLDALRQMPEQDRFVRGMIAWLGFRQTEVTFHRLERAAGETKYPLFKMARLALNAALGFSDAPLRLAVWCGLVVSGLALLYGGWVLVLWMSNDSHLVAGWSSTIVIVSLLCGMNMLMTGIVGLYVGRIHAEVKRRPLYVVQKRLGFERDQAVPARPSIHAVHE
jgi:dolichol-phosphate mannosyltransferase